MLKKSFKVIVFMLLFVITTALLLPCCGNSAFAGKITDENKQEILISSKAAILMDYNSGRVLYSKNEHQKLPIASMTKIMTIILILEEIESGRLSLDSKVKISDDAAETGGSQAFLDEGKTYKLSDLLKTVIIASANDSSVALAEAVSGTEQAFVSLMNKRARGLGLKNTNFANSTGLPAADHYSSAFDVGVMLKELVGYKTYLHYSKVWMDELIHPTGRKTELVNTNRLVKTYEACDSGKTGHTNESKYCLAASAKQNQTRLIAVIIGAEDSKIRFKETKQLLSYGFANYENKIILNNLYPITTLKVSGSDKAKVEGYISKDYSVLYKKGEEIKYEVQMELPKTIKAPIKAGDAIGTANVYINGKLEEKINIIVKENVEKRTINQTLDKIFNNW